MAKPSISLLMALYLSAEDQEAADRILKSYMRREITLEEAIEQMRRLPRSAVIL